MLTYHHISLKLLFAYKCNLVGAATFWVRYLFPILHLFSGTFFRHLLGRISLAVLQIATAFLNFRELWRPLPCGRIPSQPWSMFWYRVCAIRTYHKNKQQYWWNSNHILIIKPFKKQWIKEAVVRNCKLFEIYLPVKLAGGKMSRKNEKISSYLIYNIISFGKMAAKTGHVLQEK